MASLFLSFSFFLISYFPGKSKTFFATCSQRLEPGPP
jgi:hypothetical protein